MKRLNIGLFGHGTVAKALIDQIEKEHSTRVSIRKVCVRSWKRDYDHDPRFTLRPDDLLEDDDIDVFVELTSSINEPKQWLWKAHSKGKAFVTANKRMIAESLGEISRRCQQSNVPLLYEAAAAAALPVIQSIDGRAWHNNQSAIEGVLNGSTNFILSKMSQGESYSTALSEAQELGFAETDPRFDVESIDPTYKLAILLFHSFGTLLSIDDIPHFGITSITSVDIDFAKSMGREIKVLAKAELINNTLSARVGPTLVNGRYASVENERNAVSIRGDRFGDLYFEGRGAGGDATAQAVIADIYLAAFGFNYSSKPIRNLGDLNQTEVPIYLRYKKSERPDLTSVSELTVVTEDAQNRIITGKLTMQNLVKTGIGRGKDQFLMFLH